jgi:hypothetical protein
MHAFNANFLDYVNWTLAFQMGILSYKFQGQAHEAFFLGFN